MKNILLTIFIFISTFNFSNAFCNKMSVVTYKPCDVVKINKNLFKVDLVPHYNSPFYVYNNEFKVSVTKDIKFWVDYNDFTLITKVAEDKIQKYTPRISATLRFKLHWFSDKK